MNAKKTVFVFFMIILVSAMTASCSKYGGEWVAKFDGTTITTGELDTLYYAQQKSLYNVSKEKIDEMAMDPAQVAKNPTLNKSEFLEQLIRQRLVYNKAVEDGTMKQKEVDALVEMAREAVVVGYYVRDRFKNEIEPTPKEVEDIYTREKARFQGVPAEQAEMFIRQQIQQQKLQGKIRELVENLRDQKGIKKNVEAIKKEEKKATEKTK